jgi:hypothetical protein
VTNVNSMNMGRVVVDYGEGLADLHIDPDNEEDSTASAESAKPAAEDDDVTVITDNTSIGPTVFNMSDKNKDDPSIDEAGRLRQKPQRAQPKSRLQQHQQQVRKANQPVGISDAKAEQIVKAASRESQPAPNASQGQNETAAGTPPGGTGVT